MSEEQSNEQQEWELSFFSALRGLLHLYFLLEDRGVKLHASCDGCREVESFRTIPRYRGPETLEHDWQRAFSNARNGLVHLYYLLEEAKAELHSRCDGCFEIRNFLNTPDYRGNRADTIGVAHWRRPLNT